MKKIIEFCVAKGIEATEERVRLNAEMLLKKYNANNICMALDRLFWKLKFFPDASEIAKEIEPDEKDNANEMAGAILDAATRYSEIDASNAKKELGDIAWYAVEQFGGWDVLCRLEYDQLGTARAQLRDLCKSVNNNINKNPDHYKLIFSQRRNQLKPLCGGMLE